MLSCFFCEVPEGEVLCKLRKATEGAASLWGSSLLLSISLGGGNSLMQK